MIRYFCCPNTGRKEIIMKKRPCAYISVSWSGNLFDDMDTADKACRMAYDAGLTPVCPILEYRRYLRDDIPQEHKDMMDMAHEHLRRCSTLVVCGSTTDETIMDDIAIADRRGLTITSLDGIMIRKKIRHD